MAGDWIKVEHATLDKPEVHAIAETLKIPPEHVVGCLLRVWVWADQQVISGNAASVTKVTLDRLCFVTGFADAMELAGWLKIESGRCTFPKFDRHNGQTSKQRALTAKRVARCKAKNGNDLVTVTALPREEKRRVLNKQTDNACSSCDLLSGTILDSDDFRSAWKLCCAHLGANADRGLNPAWEQATLAELARRGYDKALADVRFTLTIANARNICDSSDQKTNGGRKKAAGEQPEDDFSEFVRKNLGKGKPQ